MEAPYVELPPTFNSSDFEMSDDEGQPKKKRKTGQGIAQAILRNQAVDRRESKKALRTQTFSHGAPGTRSNQDAVVASWDAYCQTIGHPIAECPTGDRIFQYLDTIVRNSKSTIAGKPAISLTVIRAIWMRIVQLLRFRHEHILKLYTPHHVTRIEIHLQQLVSQGKLVRGTWYKKQWISFMTLFKIASSWLAHALMNGTYSWDITLTKLASVVTQSALSSRAGDITRSQLYEGLECLCWKDITLQLDSASDRGAPSVQDLRGTFVLCFTKGAKRTRNAHQQLYCDPLSNMSQSPACAIKLILAMALRQGFSHGSTLDEVLRHTARRADGIIQWTRSDLPVFCQLRKGLSPFLKLEKPAGQEQILHSLREMAHRAGILEDRIDTRALRRGALRDQAYAKKSVSGVATRATAMIAGHSNKSFAMGTTRDYVGALEISSYNLRAEDQRVDRMAPAFAEEGPSGEWVRRFTPQETNDYMKSNDMNPQDAKQRKVAGRRMKRDREALWRKQAKEQPLRARTASEPDARIPDHAAQKYFATPAVTVVESQLEVPSTDGLLLDPRLREHDQLEEELERAAMKSLTDSVFLEGERMIDDHDAVAGQIDAADEVDSAMQDALLSGDAYTSPGSAFLAPTQGMQLSEITTWSGDEFVRFLSQINIFETSNASFDRNNEEELRKNHPSGNSRDPPTPWLHYCKSGCGHSSFSHHYMKDHEITCNGQPREKPCKCPREGCGKSFKNDDTMKAHVAGVHDFKPVACDVCPDKPEVLYATMGELKHHQEHEHTDPIEETVCPLSADCKSDRKFNSKRALKKHLRVKHGLTVEQLKKYFVDGRKGRKKRVGTKRKPKGWHLNSVPAGDEQDGQVDGGERL